MKTFLKTALALSVMMSVAACTKDKNEQDYDQQKAQQDLAQYQTAAGTYSGLVRAATDNGLLGALQIKLSATLQTVANSTGPAKSISQPIMIAYVQFKNSVNSGSEASSSNTSYDPSTGTLIAIFDIKDAQQNTQEIHLDARVQSGHVIGSVYLTSAPSSGASFDLILNGTNLDQLATSTSIGHPISYKTLFNGTTQFNTLKETKPVSMVVVQSHADSAQTFVDIINPNKTVNVTFNYGQSAQVVYNNASWDQVNNVITGQAFLSYSGSTSNSSSGSSGNSGSNNGNSGNSGSGQMASNQTVEVDLFCQTDATQKTFSCQHTSSGYGTLATSSVTQSQDGSVPNLNGDDSTTRSTIVHSFTGELLFNNVKYPTTMSVSYLARTRAQEIYLLYAPQSELPVQIAISPTNGSAGFTFTQATMDTQGKVLTATGNDALNNSTTINSSLNCSNFDFYAKTYSFKCYYFSSLIKSNGNETNLNFSGTQSLK